MSINIDVNQCCGDCIYYSGEECTSGPNEGSECYDDSTACDNFEQIEDVKHE